MKRPLNENYFYVYHWIDPKTSIVFYVGKGSWDRKNKLHKTQRCYFKFKSLLDEGFKKNDIVRVIAENLSEDDALDLEEQEIKKYKRLEDGGTLFNWELGRGERKGSKNKIIDPKIIDEILNLYKQGHTALDIGKQFNCHETTILRYLRQFEIKVRSRGYFFFNENDHQRIISMYNEGLTREQISKKMNCSQPTISEILKKNNIKAKKTVKWNNGIFSNKETINDIINQYQNNVSAQKLAQKYGVTFELIRTILKKNGKYQNRKKYFKKCVLN